jgi:hypothetical protein
MVTAALLEQVRALDDADKRELAQLLSFWLDETPDDSTEEEDRADAAAADEVMSRVLAGTERIGNWDDLKAEYGL